jgi:hypothetical protein
MRQAGILAAAGLIALREMTLRLHEDHANARRLAEGLAAIPGLEVDLDRQYINMVFFRLADGVPLSTPDICARLREKNIYVEGYDAHFRLVTHTGSNRRGRSGHQRSGSVGMTARWYDPPEWDDTAHPTGSVRRCRSMRKQFSSCIAPLSPRGNRTAAPLRHPQSSQSARRHRSAVHLVLALSVRLTRWRNST